MPQINWVKWDWFQIGDGKDPETSGYGMVLPDGQAILFKGVGGRTGWKIVKEAMPTNAQPLSIPARQLHGEPRIAFNAVKVALS